MHQRALNFGGRCDPNEEICIATIPIAFIENALERVVARFSGVSIKIHKVDFIPRNIQLGETKMSNVLMVIAPYWYQGTWVFDDESVGLVREPFVSGVPEMIDELVH